MISKKCTNYKTPETRTDFYVKKSLDTLVKHYLECPSNTVMNKFKLIPRGNFEFGFMSLFRLSLTKFPKIFFEFSCSEAKIERTIWATSSRTTNKDNELKNLKSQMVIAHDLNAISSFHMQCPKGTIFFEMRISVLKGDASTFYPNYLKDNSKNPGEDLKTTLKAKDSKPKDHQQHPQHKTSNSPTFVGKY